MMLALAAVSMVTATPRFTAATIRVGAGGVAQVGHLDRERLARARDEREPLAREVARIDAVVRAQQVVERALGVERGPPAVPLGEPRRRLGAGDLDDEVDVVQAEVVADAHAAEDDELVVEDVELRVVVAVVLVRDRDVGVAEQGVGESLSFCRSEPHFAYEAMRNHVDRRALRPTFLWKKLCRFPSKYS